MHQQYATAVCRAKRLLVSCPGRGAALFALLRRAGTHDSAKLVDPGPTAHHAASHSASKTRVKRADGIAQHPGKGLPRLPAAHRRHLHLLAAAGAAIDFVAGAELEILTHADPHFAEPPLIAGHGDRGGA